MTLVSLTTKRKEIIDQFPIQDRDAQVYSSIDVAVEDALRRSFKDINFRTMTSTKGNDDIKKILERINGSRKIKAFDVATIADPKVKKNITDLVAKLKSNALEFNDCNITEYLIIELINVGFVRRFTDYFNISYCSDFDAWHNETAEMFLGILKTYYDKANYGKAQKIVNMMFKHLYCMNFGSAKAWEVLCEEYFVHCHMPLDSFTLDWLHRKDGVAVCEWSNLEYNSISQKGKASTSYKEYLNRVKSQFPIMGYTAFQAEFYIWPQMQITQAFESIYRMDHDRADVEKFMKEPISKKCVTMITEMTGMTFPKSFI